MTQYKKTNITAKKGVNFVRSIVEDSGCLFHKIEQENDLGIDGLIEFIRNELPAHKSLALQIKSGPSYYNKATHECLIPIESHRDYWTNYPLPVCGIVYIPELNVGHWINIKTYLKHNKDSQTIRFIGNRSNQFDLLNFNRLFIPNVLSETPFLPLEEALSFFDSPNENESVLGAFILFRRYINEIITWERFINHVQISNPEDINISILHYLSHIPWHPDIFYSGEMPRKAIKDFVTLGINKFEKVEVVKLLSLISEEIGIERGSIGQTIESIISVIKNINEILESIINDINIELWIRHNAATIYAYYNGKSGLKILKQIDSKESWYISEIVKYIEEFGGYNPYQ